MSATSNQTTTTSTSNGNFERTIKAFRDGQKSLWAFGRALLDEWVPANGTTLSSADYEPLAQAFASEGLEPPAYETARKARKTAEYFPATEVVDGASWTAHREAANRSGSAKAARNVLKACVNAFTSDPANAGKTVVITRDKVIAQANTLSKGSSKSHPKNGKVDTLSVASLTRDLGKLRAKTHLVRASVADLNKLETALAKASDLVSRHVSARQARGQLDPVTSTSKAKSASKAPASKAPASSASKGKPAQARGSK